MKPIIKICVVFFLFCFFVKAQDLSKKAEENPLDLAFFMIKSHNSPEDYTDALQDVAWEFFRAGRKSDALAAADLMDFRSAKTMTFSVISHWLIRDKKFKEAEFYLAKASEANRKNKYGIDAEDSGEIAGKWILINREDRAIAEIELFEKDQNKASVLRAIAEAFINSKKFEKADKYLTQAKEKIETIENTEFSVLTKARIANSFAAIKNQTSALKLIAEVERDFQTIEYSPTYPKKDEIYDLIADTYLLAGNPATAYQLISEKFDPNSPNGLIKLAEAKIKLSYKKEVHEILQKVSSFENDNYNLKNAVKLYLQIGEDLFAVELAKSIKADYTKFGAFNLIAENFIERGKTDEATTVLNYWLEEVIRSDESDFDYNDFFEKENNIAIIGDYFSDLNKFESVLKIINLPHKTDVQASEFAAFTYSYKNKITRKNALEYLNRAVKILQTNKREITEAQTRWIWLKVARQFANYGNKEKSLAVMTEVLDLIGKKDNVGESELIGILANLGVSFEDSKLVADKKTKIALKKIRDKWFENEF